MITVYSKNNCPFCVQAKNRLTQGGFQFEEINIEEDAQAREWLIAQGHRTMPQIYHKMTDNEINEKLGNIDVTNLSI